MGEGHDAQVSYYLALWKQVASPHGGEHGLVLRETVEALDQDMPCPGDAKATAGVIAARRKGANGLHPRVLNFDVGGKGEDGGDQSFNGPSLAEKSPDGRVGTEVADFDAAWFQKGGWEEEEY